VQVLWKWKGKHCWLFSNEALAVISFILLTSLLNSFTYLIQLCNYLLLKLSKFILRFLVFFYSSESRLLSKFKLSIKSKLNCSSLAFWLQYIFCYKVQLDCELKLTFIFWFSYFRIQLNLFGLLFRR
jgi:hypothetical protein